MHPANNEYRVLITGCGRSGTKYIAAVLRRLGSDTGHETLASAGAASWLMAVDCTETPYGVGRHGLRFSTVLHQVRHPLKVIPSLTTLSDVSWHFIARHIPCPADVPIIQRAARYWYYWNLEAERLAEWTYRIEALPQVFDEFCRRLGIRPQYRVLENTSELTNSRKIRDSTRFLRLILDRLDVCQSSRLFEFTFDSKSDYLGEPLTWGALEKYAPGSSDKIRRLAIRYGYNCDDENGGRP